MYGSLEVTSDNSFLDIQVDELLSKATVIECAHPKSTIYILFTTCFTPDTEPNQRDTSKCQQIHIFLISKFLAVYVYPVK